MGNSTSGEGENEGSGRALVELLSMRANLSVVGTEIVVFDGRRGQIIYTHKEEKAQEGMIDLELTGPYRGISALGPFAIKIDIPAAAPIKWEWDCYDQERINEVDEPPRTEKICNGMAEVTYAVMSDALEAIVHKVKLAGLPDEHSRISIHGEIAALIDSFNGRKSFLFKRTLEAPLCLTLGDDKSWFLLPLARNVIAVPCGDFLHIEVNLHIVEIPNKQFKANLTFGNGIQSQVNNDKDVEVNIAWYPEIEMATSASDRQVQKPSEDIGEQIVITTPELSHHAETEMATAQPSYQLEQTSEEIGELGLTTAQKPIQEGYINMGDYPEMLRLIEMFQAVSEANVEVDLHLIDEQHSRVYGKISALIKDERNANFQVWRGIHSFNSQLELKMSVVAVPSGWVLDVVKVDLCIENDNSEANNLKVTVELCDVKGCTKTSHTCYREKGEKFVVTITRDPEVYLREDNLPFRSQLSMPVEVKIINGHPTVVYTIGDELSFTEFIMILRRILADHPDRQDFLDITNLNFYSREHPMLAKQRSGQPARWLHVRLQVANDDGEITSWTTLIMRDDNLCVLGFENQEGDVYGLVDGMYSDGMLPEHVYRHHRLDWTVEYESILGVEDQKQAAYKLLCAHLGRDFAKEAVRVLSRFTPGEKEGDDDDDPARLALAGLIVMVRESAGMYPIHDAFVAGWRTGSGFTEDLMDSFVWKYGEMSGDLRAWKRRNYAAPYPFKQLETIYLVLNDST